MNQYVIQIYQQVKQAKRMMKGTESKYPPANVGDTVLVPVPDVDKGKMDSRNLVVLERNEQEGLYRLGTTSGTLSQQYTRGEIIPVKGQFLTPDQVDSQVKSVRTVAKEQSSTGGQGFKKCNCLKSCDTKRCSCKAAGVLCNSRCHNSITCKNKHQD